MIRTMTTASAFLTGLVLALPSLLLLVPLWTFNAAVNLVRAFLSWRIHRWSEILRFEPEIGWRPLPNLKAEYFDRIGDRCSIRTDPEGWPGACSMEEAEIVAFGDSFAFGYGAPGRREYFSFHRHPRIKPVGAPGYNMVQELMWMKRYESRLAGKLVLWFICVENDLVENLKAYNPKFYTNPFVRREEDGRWVIASEHVRRDKLMHGNGGASNRLLFSHLCIPGPYADRVFSAAEYLIREGKAVCDRAGAELALFSIPYKYQMSRSGTELLKGLLSQPTDFDVARPENVLERICREISAGFVRGSNHLTASDYKERDGHWNARGNEKVAAVIRDFYRDRHPGWSERAPAVPRFPVPDFNQLRESA